MGLRFLKLMAFLLFITMGRLTAQTAYPVSGRVVDAQSHEPIEGAVIYLGHEVTTSDQQGDFSFSEVKPGAYSLNVSILGYRSSTLQLTVGKKVRNLHIHLEPTGISLPEVQVEADFLRSGPRESSLNGETVDRDFLEKNYGNTLSNTLEKIPGITSMNTGVGISKPVIRGMTFNRVIVNENGIKQEGQQWGADHGLEIDQYRVEKIEVVKGPASMLYGSDGISGVINIQPGPAPEIGTFKAELLANWKSNNNLLGGSIGLAGNFAGYFFRLRYTEQHFADYRVPAESFTYNGYVLPIEGKILKNTAGWDRNFSGEIGVLREWGVIRASVSNFQQLSGFFPGAIGIPRSYLLNPDGNAWNTDLPRQQVDHLKTIVNAKLFLKKNLLEFDLGYQNNQRKEESSPHSHGAGPSPAGVLALGLGLQTLSFNGRFHQQIDEHLKIIYGLSLQTQQNKQSGYEFLIPAHRGVNGGSYIFGQYEAGKKMTLSLGARFDIGAVDIEADSTPIYLDQETIIGYWQRTPYIDRLFYNYSWAAGYSWYPDDHFNLKINLGRAFRIPTAAELGENGVHHGTFRHEQGDPALKPETGYQLDLGFQFRNEKLLAKLSPFFNFFDNYIYLKPTGSFSTLPDAGQVYKYTQNSAIYSGFELLVEYHILKELHVSSSAEYVWNYNIDTYLPLPFTPPFSLSNQVDYTFVKVGKFVRQFLLSLEYKWVNAQNQVDRNEAPTPGYHLINFNSGADFHFGRQKIALFLGVRNLLDYRYMNHLSRYRILNLPEQGINFNLGLKLPIDIIKPK